jgi:hypothetical protein
MAPVGIVAGPVTLAASVPTTVEPVRMRTAKTVHSTTPATPASQTVQSTTTQTPPLVTHALPTAPSAQTRLNARCATTATTRTHQTHVLSVAIPVRFARTGQIQAVASVPMVTSSCQRHRSVKRSARQGSQRTPIESAKRQLTPQTPISALRLPTRTST